MSGPTPAELARAEAFGRVAARGGCQVTSCPYEANGTPSERVLSARFVRAFLAHGGTITVDFGDGPGRTRDVQIGQRRLQVTVRRAGAPPPEATS